MKIIVKRNEQPKITFDLKDVHSPYAIRNAIKLALEIEGFTKETIAEVFNQMPDVKCEEAKPIGVPNINNVCTIYQQDDTTAMNCRYCGKSKFMHGNSLYGNAL
jgi:hypothetical protein